MGTIGELINILVSINKVFMPQLKAMLHSLFINNADCEFNIFLLHSELEEEDLALIEKLAARYNGTFFSYYVEKERRDALNVSEFFPPEVFYRLISFDYLPKHVNKVLYLDCDIIINGSVAELYNKAMILKNEEDGDFKYLFAAAPDIINMQSESESYRALMKVTGLMPSQPYINSGVLLINLEMLRTVLTAEELIKQINTYRNVLVFPAQDLINMMFNKHIMYLNIKQYNFGPLAFRNSAGLFPNEPVIIHFFGAFKPWNPGYPQDTPVLAEAKGLYDKYAAMDY